MTTLLEVNRALSTAISRFAATTGSKPARNDEQKTASRRTGAEAIIPALRELYRKLKTAIAASTAMSAAEIRDISRLMCTLEITMLTAESSGFRSLLTREGSGRLINQTTKYAVHMGQKRLSILLNMPELKNDIFDFIVSTSQLINKYLLEGKRHSVYKQRICRLKLLGKLLLSTVHDERLQPSGA